MNVLYEVTLHVEPALLHEYDSWLKEHVAEMLTLPGFGGARVFAIQPDNADPALVGRVVHYWLENRRAFDTYLHDHAEGMRGEGLRRFGDKVKATRRILEPVD